MGFYVFMLAALWFFSDFLIHKIIKTRFSSFITIELLLKDKNDNLALKYLVSWRILGHLTNFYDQISL